MTKPMSAADYRAHAEQVREARPTEIVTLKSGSVFELRRPDLKAWSMTGRVPQSLMAEGIKAWQVQGKMSLDSVKTDAKVVISDAEVFMLTVVEESTVCPKLAQFPDPKKNEIGLGRGPGTMLEEDFFEIYSWAMTGQGVTGLSGLKSFRAGRKRGTSTPKSGGKKQRNKSKPVIESGSLVS